MLVRQDDLSHLAFHHDLRPERRRDHRHVVENLRRDLSRRHRRRLDTREKLDRYHLSGNDPTVAMSGAQEIRHARARVSLVEKGRLKALLMSRNPSKEFGSSTGHGRGFLSPSASSACLIVTAEPSATVDELREELLEACQDEGLEYGVRVEALAGSNPLVAYKASRRACLPI